MRLKLLSLLSVQAARWVRAAGIVVLGAAATSAVADPLNEYEVKAAYLYNFAAFTEWPADLGPRLQMCVLGQDPFGTVLDRLDGRAVGARRLSVRRVRDVSAALDCHVVFVARSAEGQMPWLVQAAAERSILTISDHPAWGQSGIVINMLLVRDRVAFEVNVDKARQARLQISSKLLKLAYAVYRSDPP